MSADELDSDHQFIADLAHWLEKLSNRVSYENESGSVSREEFLRLISRVGNPALTIALYLNDSPSVSGSLSSLTLAYCSMDIEEASTRLPRCIEFCAADVLSDSNGGFVPRELNEIDSEMLGKNQALFVPLTINRHGEEGEKLLPDQASLIGALVIFVPLRITNRTLTDLTIRVAAQHLTGEIVRSRQERMTLALTDLLGLISSQYDARNTKLLCQRFNRYCRAEVVHLFERRVESYVCTETTGEAAYLGMEIDTGIAMAQDSSILRSHEADSSLVSALSPLTKQEPWMMVPCYTEGISIESGSRVRFPQYLFLLVGKDSSEYLGENFSLTDADVAKNLAALLSVHLPYLPLPKALQALSSETETTLSIDSVISRIFEIGKRLIPSLYGIVVAPEYPEMKDAYFSPAEFVVNAKEQVEIKSEFLISSITSGRRLSSKSHLYCVVYNISTDHRPHRRVIFGFDDMYLQSAQTQLLEAMAEQVHSAFKLFDFSEFMIATQAQVRHVIRGAMSAAMSDIRMISDRVRIFERVPTKLTKLFATPTMKDAVTDASLCLQEAHAMVDSPRYLLETFDQHAVRWSDVDLAAVIDWCLLLHKGEIRRRGLRFILNIDPIMKSRLISADTEFLRIVIFNLIDNAVKYSFQNQRVTIDLVYLPEDRWRFEITNMGVPIERGEKKRIFEPWARSFRHSIRNRRPGTGLGLAVSRRILEAHDDRMTFDCESERVSDKPPTAMTTFFFELSAKGKGEGASRANHSF